MKTKNLSLCFLLILGVFILAGNVFAKERSFEYDVLIKNGWVFDGSLKPAFRADVAVKGGKIVKVAPSIKGTAARVIDAKGLHITPGFIDMQSYVALGMAFPENKACLNFLTQGVTSAVCGKSGDSAWPIFKNAEDQMKRFSEQGIGLNVAMFVGHEDIRRAVMDEENREPTQQELEKMKALVKEAMEQGVYGISANMSYLQRTQETIRRETGEYVELAKVAASYGGQFHPHIRNEQDKLPDAVREAIEISEKSGAPVNISHLKVMGEPNWGGEVIKKACALIEEARARGLKITANQYPYLYPSPPYQRLIPLKTWLGDESRLEEKDFEKLLSPLSNSELIDLYSKFTPYFPLSKNHLKYLKGLSRKKLISLLAQEFRVFYVEYMFEDATAFHGPENTRQRVLFMKRMQDPEEAKKIRREVKDYLHARYAPGFSPVSPKHWFIAICIEKDLEGKSLAEVAVMKGKPVEDVAIELALMGTQCTPYEMSEEDVEYIMKKDYVATGSDGSAYSFGKGISPRLPHIRNYSCFLHKIKKYALERKVISVPHTIRSQTSLPAQIMNWKDRGWIKEAYIADIAVIDFSNIKTKASLQNPHQYCEGVRYLMVNGELVIEEGKWNGNLPGQIIKLKK